MQIEEVVSTAGLDTKGTKSLIPDGRRPDKVKQGQDYMKQARLDEVELSKTGQSISDFEDTLEGLQEYAGWGNFNINFSEDDQTGSLIVKVVDRETGETIRQIPPEQILHLKSYLQDVLGQVFDHMA
jgi:flagellar protein FlaG